MEVLPIDALLPQVVATLKRAPNLVIEAPPGAGKTTRVPPALLDEGLAGEGEVWVLEPRRIAARMSARRVAEERGEPLGETVGYQVRFEEVASPRTRLRFITEGVLTRRLLTDPTLARVGAVVLDEFHERHLQADLALALLRRLQRAARPDLRLVAMSATLDAAPVARFLGGDDKHNGDEQGTTGGCPVLRSEGRRFHVEVEHLTRPEDEVPLAAQVERALRRLVAEGLDGDALVFLPGAAEIRRAQAACAAVAESAGLLVLPLHGELPAAEQDRAVRPAPRRKVILSTNVAETSITVEGVAAVIDSGLARVASHSPWSGLPTLQVARVSQASATQRAGRAGRTRAGRCLRLYTAQDFAARPAHEEPEVRRLDLAEPALELHAAGVGDLKEFGWFEAPARAALDAAGELLSRLGAIEAGGRVTETGRRMLRLPLHPRLARIVVEAESRGVARAGCLVVALIGERDIREHELLAGAEERLAADERQRARAGGPSDLIELAELFNEAERADFAPERVRRMGLNPNALRAVERTRRQLSRLMSARGKADVKADKVSRAPEDGSAIQGSDGVETSLLISILTGYPDRVARRRAVSGEAQEAGAELLLSNGGGAVLAPESVVRGAEFLVAVDAEERRGTAWKRAGRGGSGVMVRLASAIEPEWLLDLFTERVRETTEARWNAGAERVEVVSRVLYDQLVLDEWGVKDARGEEVSRALAEAALAAGPRAFVDEGLIERFLARVEFAADAYPEARFPALGEADVRASLERMCEGRRGFAELREAARGGELLEGLGRGLSAEQQRLLASAAPERVALASGRQARVNYERHQPPWVASRLQDFFGMREGPRVAGGRVPVVLRLLAPNQRPVQVTSDLAGFWSRHYSQVRRELSRRYPRHAWPEDPLNPSREERHKR